MTLDDRDNISVSDVQEAQPLLLVVSGYDVAATTGGPVMAPLDRLISGDSHLEIDSSAWVERIPEPYRFRAPRVVPLSDGSQALLLEGSPIQDLGDSVSGGKDPRHRAPFRQSYLNSPGTGPASQRLNEQQAQGISAEVLFPGINGPRFWQHIRHESCYLAVVRAYNGYLADEYCATAPDRLLGVGVVPTTTIDDAIAELVYCHEHGLHAVVLSAFPNGGTLPSSEDDRFWATASDLNIALTIHHGLLPQTESYPRDRSGARDTSERALRKLPDFALLASRVSMLGGVGALPAMYLALSGLFDRFPTLQIFFAETQIGWLPFFLEQADETFRRQHGWVEQELGWQPVKHLPSDYLRQHCHWGFQQDRFGVMHRGDIGTARLIWGTNFPHEDAPWPSAHDQLSMLFAGIPHDDTAKMVSENVQVLFGLAVKET